jgi:hypothetical protein
VATTIPVESVTRDGYAEMIAAFLNARFARAAIFDARANLKAALLDVANAAAATGKLGSWADVLATPLGDDRMPSIETLGVGELANFLGGDGLDDSLPSEEELDRLECAIKEAIEAAGPSPSYLEKLERLWDGEVS